MKHAPYSLLLILFSVLISSCHAPSYTFSRTSTPYGLDFRSGKWLLNHIEAPENIRSVLTEKAEEEFSNYLGDQLHFRRNAGGLLIADDIPLDPNEKELQAMKDGTGFDFVINIKAVPMRNDLGDLQIGDVDGIKRNEGQVILEVYDLNATEVIYIQEVRGDLTVQNDSKDFAFAKSANGLLIGSFKRIMKKIKKTHTKSDLAVK